MRALYGSGEEGGVGPFSVNTYLHYMLEDGIWGDNIMLGLIASMWGVRVSILLSESCAEVRLRHDMEWPECDFGLVFNCSSTGGDLRDLMRQVSSARKSKRGKSTVVRRIKGKSMK